MKQLDLIVIGHLKDQHLKTLEDHYLKQIKSFKIVIHEIKSQEENKILEAELIIKKINQINSNASVILMTERGKEMDSVLFSKWLNNRLEQSAQNLFLIIGGSNGFGEEIIKRANEQISLSKLTFPHKLARLLLIEQLYRAQSILSNHPYHK